MLGQYLKPLSATALRLQCQIYCSADARPAFFLSLHVTPHLSLTTVLKQHSQTSVGELQNALVAHLSLSGSLDTIVSFRLSLMPAMKDHSM